LIEYQLNRYMFQYNVAFIIHLLYCQKIMVMSCLLVPVMARAELTVIHDSGNTQTITPFLEVFQTHDGLPQQSPVPTGPQLGAADPKAWLPIQSPGRLPA
jgi:hypothetical protein